ncbi:MULTISPECIES: hypothetical protein [unclassified Streptomyces]|uniref:hypothetical protein n=1 Tax=unclassified Streptomyces TaxID=2593676 RepID=UPI00336A15A9
MDVVERLVLASQHASPDSVRPDAETFLARVFPELGFVSSTVSATGAGHDTAGPRRAESTEDLVQEYAIPPGPGREELLDELRQITRNRDGKDGAGLRRIAEIVELLDGEEAAYAWWRHAARAGDEVAVAVVEELHAEQDLSGERPSVFPLIGSLGPGRGSGPSET